jgi:threonine/homoserine/homoserine lactone efflux protein
MVELHSWLAFAAASLLMAVIPGPGVASIIGFAFSSGRRVAMASVAGMAIGNATAISLSLAGAGAILAASALAFTILKWIGAAYLIGIGLYAILAAKPHEADQAGKPAITAKTAFLTNVAVGIFHPKTIIFFVAFASQFINADAPFLPQALILIATFTGIAAFTDSLYALMASRASVMVSNHRFRLWAQRAGGGLLIAAGAATAAIRRP